MCELVREKTAPSGCSSLHSRANQLMRVLWKTVWLFAYRPSPRMFHGWRRFLLRLFGATIERGAHPYTSARVWAPWNLTMREGSCLGDHVECYSVDRVTLEPCATVSQYSFLCTASHDYTSREMPVIAAPIRIGRRAWVAADVFVGPGVTIGEGAVVGARASVFRNVDPWTLVGGNPARVIKKIEALQVDP
jgi:putative colanic acid biosynthesis acetyltransferase WcaF